jgi:plastocyanin
MVRTILAAALAAATLVGTGAPATSGGLEETVQVRDDIFDPAVVPSTDNPFLAGESLEWAWAPEVEASHDVRQLRGLFGSPLSSTPGTRYFRTFSSGTFPYECSIHGPVMSGIVRVKIWQGFSPSGFPLLRWAFPDTNTGRAFDVRFRIGDGPWRMWKTDTQRGYGLFGRNDRPVHFNPSKRYSFQARSQKRVDTPRQTSQWSPITPFD